MSAIGFPHSRVAWARYVGRPNVWRACGELRHSVATGLDAFRHLHGTEVWDWRAERPEETAIDLDGFAHPIDSHGQVTDGILNRMQMSYYIH